MSLSCSLSVVPAVVMITMIFEIAVSTAIRVVIVFNTASVTLPVARIIAFTIVMWCNPTSPLVRRSRPITFVPFIVFSHCIPITFYPRESRIRPWLLFSPL